MAQCVGTEVPPTVCPASPLQGSLLTHVNWHAAAMRDAARVPMAQCVGTEVPPTVHPASALQGALLTHVDCHAAAMRDAARVPMAQRVGTEVPPTVHPASALQGALLTHVDWHATAMREAACVPMVQCVGTEVPPTVCPASALQDPLSTQAAQAATGVAVQRVMAKPLPQGWAGHLLWEGLQSRRGRVSVGFRLPFSRLHDQLTLTRATAGRCNLDSASPQNSQAHRTHAQDANARCRPD